MSGGSLSCSSSPITPCQEGDGDSPISGSLGHGWGAAAPPQPWGTSGSTAGSIQHLERMGWGITLSPKSCALLLIPPMTLGKFRLFGCITQTHRDSLTPGKMLQLKFLPFLPGEMPSAAEQPRSREQRHRICSQLEMLSERGWNLIKAEPESRLRRCGCCACQMNFM